jgi:hypothetical protein
VNSTTVTTAAPGDSPRPSRANSAAAVVHASNLPPRLGELVLGVTGKCRLWKSERTDVARELCAHFLDGIDAGATPDELAASFGDPRRAARLITTTRKRLRPRWWRTSRAVLLTIGAALLLCLSLYAILLARFFLASPNIARNIASELNAPVLQTAPSDRAWPLYIQAKKEFGPFVDFTGPVTMNQPERPGDANWEKYAEWLEAHAHAFETLRAAAAKPALGYIYRAGTDPDYAGAMEITNPGYKFDPASERVSENPLAFGILLPQLGEMRRFARLLRADAFLASSRNDPARFLADIDAILGLGEHALDERFLIGQAVGVAIGELAAVVILEHVDRPEFLTPENLRDLAHRLAAYGGGGHLSMDASFELVLIDDILQRYFSDNGKGDGRFIGATDETESLYIDWGVAKPKAYPLIRAIQPVQSAIMPSRAEIRRSAEHFVAAAAADDALPPWRHDERSSDVMYHEVMESSVYAVVPFLGSLTLAGSDIGPIASHLASRDIFLARRDAALTVIAIESFRRARGKWPGALNELIPAFLPSLPLDPFDGKPLRYVAPSSEREQPLLYSVGSDGVDDRGQVTTTDAARSGIRSLSLLRKFRNRGSLSSDEQQHLANVRGDWILWPIPAPLKPGKE